MFAYSPLDSVSKEIRLVRFVGEDDTSLRCEAGISLELQHKSRDHDFSYSAISYTWGDIQDMEVIQVNGQALSVSKNLYHCLEELRNRDVNTWLWADQICICQSDIEEKGKHVREMDRIFGNADLVYAWLGPGSMDTDQAMKWIVETGSKAPSISSFKIWSEDVPHKEIHDYIEARPPVGTDDRDIPGSSEMSRLLYDILNDKRIWLNGVVTGLRDILRRDYWHRIWVVQEVALAKSLVFICGAESVSFDDLDRTCLAIRYLTHRALFHLHKEYENANEIIHGTAYDIKSLDIRRQRYSNRPVYIQNILFEHGAAPDRPHYSASDPRDLAFALVGVLNNDSRRMITVDYGQTVEKVFTTLTRAMMKEPRGRFNLDWCSPRNEETTLPSWVPDWRQVGRYGFSVYPITYQSSFNATAGMEGRCPTNVEDFEELSFLHFHGHFVDVITDVMAPPEWSKENEWDIFRLADAKAWLDSVHKFAVLDSESGPAEDYIWRTILRNYDLLSHGFDRKVISEDVLQLIRNLFRQKPIDSNTLSESQLDFIRTGTYHPHFLASLGDKEGQVAYVEKNWCHTMGSINRQRTLFKTNKGMFGLGHESVKVGDFVTLLQRMKAPIILRKRSSSPGFFFAGDAYVDGIMYGEFLDTQPTLEEFHIY